MKDAIKQKLEDLKADAHNLMLEPEVLRDDGASHVLYHVVTTLNQLLNRLDDELKKSV